MALYNFTEKEIATLREVIASQQRTRQNPPTARTEPDLGTQSNEVYIAWLTGDLPALTQASGTGTGTGTPGPDKPGTITAEIHRIDKTGHMVQAFPKTRVVYNMTSAAIEQDWVLIAKDKFGKWIAVFSVPICVAQNAIHQYTVIGSPTGGTFDVLLTVNGVEENIIIWFDYTEAETKTAFATHSELAESDLTTAGGPFPNATVEVEFGGNVANTKIDLPTLNWDDLGDGTTGTGTQITGSGTGIAVIPSLAQLGIP